MWFVQLLLFFCISSRGAEFAEENDVFVLNKDNFHDAVQENKYLLVEFYAPWCGHCKSLAPEYEKAAKQLKSEGSLVRLAKVDATVENELAEKYKVSGYPTLKFFKEGNPINFNGGRSSAEIVSWCKKKLGPTLQTLDTLTSVDEFIKSNSPCIIGFMGPDSDDAVKLESVAAGIDDPFGITNNPEVLKKYGITKRPGVVLFKKFDEERVDFDGNSYDELADFVAINKLPLVTEFSRASAGDVFGSPLRKHLIVFISKKEHFTQNIDTFTAVAKASKGRLHLIVVDTDVEEHLPVLDHFALKKADVPAYRYLELEDEPLKYVPESSELSLDSMLANTEKFLASQLKIYLMSEEIPKEQTGPVRVLVGKNYNEAIRNKSAFVFVMLYAPWCGHCKALSHVWEDLAKSSEGEDDVIIAKMDATANEAEGLKVQSFPTLKFSAKDSDEVMDYAGDRTIDALMAFVQLNGKSAPPSGDKRDGTAQDDHTKDEL